VRIEGTNKNDMYDGKSTYYYEDGTLMKSVDMKGGKKNGHQLIYNVAGYLEKDTYFIDDIREGPYFKYDSNGDIVVEGQYSNDEYVGDWTTHKNGKQYLMSYKPMAQVNKQEEEAVATYVPPCKLEAPSLTKATVEPKVVFANASVEAVIEVVNFKFDSANGSYQLTNLSRKHAELLMHICAKHKEAVQKKFMTDEQCAALYW